jgi:hypothetical protein
MGNCLWSLLIGLFTVVMLFEYVYHYLFLLVTSNLVNRWMVDLCSTFILDFFLHLYGGILSLLKVFKWSCFYMSYVAGCVSTCRMWLFNSWHCDLYFELLHQSTSLWAEFSLVYTMFEDPNAASFELLMQCLESHGSLESTLPSTTVYFYCRFALNM